MHFDFTADGYKLAFIHHVPKTAIYHVRYFTIFLYINLGTQ